MSPTRTERSPGVTACAAGALIWSMSHWRPDRVSPVGAVGAAAVVCVAPASEPSSMRVANFAVAETPSTPLVARMVCANDDEVDEATTTEIDDHDDTTRPPAALTAVVAADTEEPCDRTTR